jgi:formylglycine-generating enzyme required for sulfatase activity
MSRTRRLLPLVLPPALAAALLVLGLVRADDRPPRKVAFVVGVAKYDHAFADLQFPERDAADLAATLRQGGFDVVLLTGSAAGKDRATRKNIEDRLAELLDGGPRGGPDDTLPNALANAVADAHKIRKGDLVLVALSGHGLQLEVADPSAPGGNREDAFFCPVDAKRNDPKTLVSLSHLLDEVLAPCGSRNLLLVDACRDIADPNKGRKGVEGRDMALKGETAVLFNCGRGEKSWENKDLGHGVFTHAVLRGLRGEAATKGVVTWSSLVSHVQEEMASEEFRKLIPEGYTQTPIPTSGQLPRTVLLTKAKDVPVAPPDDTAVTRKRPLPLDCTGEKGVSAAEVRRAQEAWAKYLGRQVEEEDEIAPGVKMKLVLVPPGRFLMGSPEGEKNRYKGEVQHEVTLRRPFYLGKYEVTQAQYEAVIGTNPSHFKGADLPVERVSWTEADTFADTLTKQSRDGLAFRLPTEAEWEYACRGGRPSSMPFGIGDGTSLSTDQANFENKLGKTTPVGFYRRPNDFGLEDIHGNVWEWCADWWYDKYPTGKVMDPSGPASASAYGRVTRGGSWLIDSSCCRASNRGTCEPSRRNDYQGFRVAAVPSGAGK